MKSNRQYSLRAANSFKVDSICSEIYFPQTLIELQQLPNLQNSPFYILGEGSNTLFTENVAPIIIRPSFKGITVSETDYFYFVKVGASENWHELVCFCTAQGMFGLENLALIPGSAGAAPVQNIGAYGTELSDYCSAISWFEFSTKNLQQLTAKECLFSYRDSIFKQQLYNKGLITDITLRLPKQWQANVSYQGLDSLPDNTDAINVMKKVIALRQAKLPDPKVLPNAGSFFKNPIVSASKLEVLQSKYQNLPFYPQSDGNIKLAAGWLIDQTGFKGYRINDVGVHQHQALVLVNYGGGDGRDIVRLAKQIQSGVNKKFDIILQPEVRMVTAKGLVTLNELG